tara:strand:- start:136 stop:1443 length:1308 start_codon:yes stop_codon:yes gene_type:complete
MLCPEANRQQIENVNDILSKTKYNIKDTKDIIYNAVPVSWDDVDRCSAGSSYTGIFGNYSTDHKLITKNGDNLFFIRPNNHIEIIGATMTSEVFVVVNVDGSLVRKPLNEVLKAINGSMCNRSFSETFDFSNGEENEKISIRSSLSIITSDETNESLAISSYDYSTTSNEYPATINLLCTTQGIFLNESEVGQHLLMAFQQDENTGLLSKCWFRSDKTRFKPSEETKETDAEKKDAVKKGLATSEKIGTKSMGETLQTLMVVTIPLIKPEPIYFGYEQGYEKSCFESHDNKHDFEEYRSFNEEIDNEFFGHEEFYEEDVLRSVSLDLHTTTTFAARVSIGSTYELEKPIPKYLERNPDVPISVTVINYLTTQELISEKDLIDGINRTNILFKDCFWTGPINENGAMFMSSNLTEEDWEIIRSKVYLKSVTNDFEF